MKERPIIFSGPMVKAILDGRKTQTRRLFKGKYYPPNDMPMFRRMLEECPYGKCGDQLWVREGWRLTGSMMPAVGAPKPDYSVMRPEHFVYAADCKWDGPFTSARFMPRAACRLRLGIIGLSLEHLQDITEEDAEAEGISTSVVDPWPLGVKGCGNPKNYVYARDRSNLIVTLMLQDVLSWHGISTAIRKRY